MKLADQTARRETALPSRFGPQSSQPAPPLLFEVPPGVSRPESASPLGRWWVFSDSCDRRRASRAACTTQRFVLQAKMASWEKGLAPLGKSSVLPHSVVATAVMWKLS